MSQLALAYRDFSGFYVNLTVVPHLSCWLRFPENGQMVIIRVFFFLIEACAQRFQRLVLFAETEDRRNVQDFLRK